MHELLGTIADYNIAQVKKALTYDIDAVYFGDDWGQQRGLQMGAALWREFILPQVKRMYGVVREAGKFVIIHSCGDVDELFDDLVAAGAELLQSLPARSDGRGRADEAVPRPPRLPRRPLHAEDPALRHASRTCSREDALAAWTWAKTAGYLLAPAHDVEGDVPLENMLAFIEVAQGQLAGA